MPHDDVLKNAITMALRSFDLRPLAAGPQGRAAVALVISEEGLGAQLPSMPVHPHWSTHAAMILTRRAAHLRRHAGQWALPGGRIEPDESVEQAALRELGEEVGLHLKPDAVLGRLDDYATRSGFVVSPVVLWADAARGMRANADEVAAIHRIALSEFERADAPMLETHAGQTQPVLRMPIGAQSIAAPTAALLYQFREVCLRHLPTRVAHFEQPEFAWR